MKRRKVTYVKLHGVADTPCCVGEAAGSPVPGLTVPADGGDFAGFTVCASRNGDSASVSTESPSGGTAVGSFVPSGSGPCDAGQVFAAVVLDVGCESLVRRRRSHKSRPLAGE